MQGFYPNQDTVVRLRVTAISGNTPITTGTVTAQLVDQDGANENKWWDAANEEWSATEASAGTATYRGGAVWTVEISGDALLANTRYSLYVKESGDLHAPWDDTLYPLGVAYDGTVETAAAPGEVDVCNFALGLLGGAANAKYPWLDSLDEDAADEKSLPAVRWCQIMLPRSRDKIQSIWDWPECTRFALMGTHLAAASAQVVPGWDYLYTKPSGCLAFRGIAGNDVNTTTGVWREYPFLEVGEQIACNIDNDDDDPQYLFRYLVRVTDVTKWSRGLFEAIGHLLAIYLSRPMGATDEAQTKLINWYRDAYNEARSECQKRVFEMDSRSQLGTDVEMGPGLIDYNFPQPS